jgi:hypothetical protein
VDANAAAKSPKWEVAMKKLLVVIVLLLGVGVGVAWAAGGVDRSYTLGKEYAAGFYHDVRDRLSPSPPAKPSTPPRAVTVAKPQREVARLPKQKIERRPDGKPRERLTQADRDRLGKIIDHRL